MRRAGERNLVHVAAYECRAFDIHFTCDIRSGFYDRGKSCCSGGLPKEPLQYTATRPSANPTTQDSWLFSSK
jgi:hypothetical protein